MVFFVFFVFPNRYSPATARLFSMEHEPASIGTQGVQNTLGVPLPLLLARFAARAFCALTGPGEHMQRHDCQAITLFDADGRRWRIVGELPLFDMELLLGKRLELAQPYSIELIGRAISLYEWGALIQANQPNTDGLIEFQHGLWAFSDWLDHLEQQGTQRGKVLGSTGLPALVWHEHYLRWAHDEEYRHTRHLLEQGHPLENLMEWHPRMLDNPRVAKLVKSFEQNGLISKRGKGRPGHMTAAVRELAALAFDIHRHDVPGVADSFLAACWHACNLRPEWVPSQWTVQAGTRADSGTQQGPGLSLYRAATTKHIAARSPDKHRPLADILYRPVPARWEGCRPPGWRSRNKK